MTGHELRFLGLTKTQFAVTLVALWVGTVLLLGLGVFILVDVSHQQDKQLVLLCERGDILDATVMSALQLIESQSRTIERENFIQDFRAYHTRLVHESQPGQPCG